MTETEPTYPVALTREELADVRDRVQWALGVVRSNLRDWAGSQYAEAERKRGAALKALDAKLAAALVDVKLAMALAHAEKAGTVYLAARYSRREELIEYASELRMAGHTVTAHWLAVQTEAEATREERRRFAEEDWSDIRTAATVVCFTDPPRSDPAGASRGGRHVELGLALAWGKRVVVVGPEENVFCCLPQVQHYATWGEARREVFGV